MLIQSVHSLPALAEAKKCVSPGQRTRIHQLHKARRRSSVCGLRQAKSPQSVIVNFQNSRASATFNWRVSKPKPPSVVTDASSSEKAGRPPRNVQRSRQPRDMSRIRSVIETFNRITQQHISKAVHKRSVSLPHTIRLLGLV